MDSTLVAQKSTSVVLSISDPLWFQTIGVSMLVMAIILAIGIFLPTQEYKIIFCRFIGILLFSRFVFFHGYEVGNNHWEIDYNLPLHLCGISSILSWLVMIKYNQKMFNFLALLGIPTAIHSFLTPEWTHGWDGYLFPDFYFAHGGILFAPIFLMVVFGHKISENSWKTVFFQSLVIAFFVGIMNIILKSNYLYLCVAPIAENPLIITREWPFYIPIIIFIGFLHILAFYYFFNLIKKVKKHD